MEKWSMNTKKSIRVVFYVVNQYCLAAYIAKFIGSSLVGRLESDMIYPKSQNDKNAARYVRVASEEMR